MAKNRLHTVAFYNLENLFDTENDPHTLDDEYTPAGDKRWNEKRYRNKIGKLGRAIAGIGTDRSDQVPMVVGVAEVENEQVLADLVESNGLRKHGFEFVHFDSPDERGIDCGLLFRSDGFEVQHSRAVPLLVYNDEGIRDYTRDILYVQGLFNGENMHFLVNHWPSRRRGKDDTDRKRIKAAGVVRELIAGIRSNDPEASIIIMGDFNDDPVSLSVNRYLLDSDLYNPMTRLWDPGNRGSLNYNFRWNLFDQIIISTNFLQPVKGTHLYDHSQIHDDHQLREWSGKFKGTPFRTYAGDRYFGGFSDHFPVYIQLRYLD